eukprot:3419017-Amphidinium_carterae.1
MRKESPSIVRVCVKVGVIPNLRQEGTGLDPPPLQQRASWIEYVSIQHGVRDVHWLRKFDLKP